MGLGILGHFEGLRFRAWDFGSLGFRVQGLRLRIMYLRVNNFQVVQALLFHLF